MIKITKNDFRRIHSSGNLTILGSMFGMDKETVLSKMLKGIESGKFHSIAESKTRPVSRIDLKNDSGHIVTACYGDIIDECKVYFVETVIDNSKNSQCSWNDIETNTVVYRYN